jgi:hypothetical protein
MFDRTTYFQAILIFAFLIVNVLFITFEIYNSLAVMSRLGLMLYINLTLLLFEHDINIVFRNRSSISEDYNKIHRWLEKVAVIESIIYSAIVFVFSISNPDIISQISI